MGKTVDKFSCHIAMNYFFFMKEKIAGKDTSCAHFETATAISAEGSMVGETRKGVASIL